MLTVKTLYSVLENGHLVAAKLALGTMFQTQWGPRQVVAHQYVTHALDGGQAATEQERPFPTN